MEDGGYMNIFASCDRYIFQDFESSMRTEVDLVQDDIRLVLDNYNSSFITYEIKQGIYIFEDLSEVFLKSLQLEFGGVDNAIDIEFDEISMRT